MRRNAPAPLLHAARSVRRLTPVLSLLTGCTTWSADRTPPSANPVDQPARHVRLLLRDGTHVEVYGMAIRSDSVVGRLRQEFSGTTEFAVPVSEVVRVEHQEFHAVRTALLVLGLAATAAALYVALALAEVGPGY